MYLMGVPDYIFPVVWEDDWGSVHVVGYEARNALHLVLQTAQKMKFSVNDFFSKCEQIDNFL